MPDDFAKALNYLGWQGGTVHQVRAALEQIEADMIEEFNRQETEQLRLHIAAVQMLLSDLKGG